MSESGWAEVGSFTSQFDADLSKARLESAGIPVMVKGPMTGAFGPGFVGWTPEGVRLYVPLEFEEVAAELLSDEDEEGADADE